MTAASVIVVGAGIAGLTAAWRLHQAGFAVTVLEAQEQPGGRMSARQSGPIRYNTGARLIYPFGRELHALIGELGLRGELIALPDLHAMCRAPEGRYRIDLMPGPSALGTPGLRLADRLRLARSAIQLLALRRGADPDSALSAIAHDHETLAAYLDRTAGERVRKRMIEPVFRGARSWDAHEVSPAFYLSTTPRLIGEREVYTLAGGVGRVTEALAGRLDVRCATRVVAVRRSDDAPCEVVCRDSAGRDGRTTELSADLVLCAVEGAGAAGIVATPLAEEADFLPRVRYNSSGIVHYALDGDLPEVLEFATTDVATRIATWQQIPAHDGAGAGLYCQLTPEATREAIARGLTDRLDDLLRDEIRTRIPDVDTRITHLVNQWIPRMLPLFYPGYGHEVARFLQWQAQARKRVYYCGDYLGQALLNGACESGAATARLIRSHWRALAKRCDS